MNYGITIGRVMDRKIKKTSEQPIWQNKTYP